MKSENCKMQIERAAGPRGSTISKVLQFTFFIFQFSFFNLCASHAYAAGDADMDKPYKVQLVLRFAEHRLLTDAFKDKVERELKDSLQAALGEMGQVSVVRDHPKLKEIEQKGLQVLDDKDWREVNGVKTHFVLIDLKDGEYEIRARQHDGYTGQASHLRKPERVTDRQIVARTATLLIERDFGVVGTVKPINAESVQVRFLAGNLDDSLRHWVKKGDTLSVVQMDGPHGRALRWTLLQVQDDPKDGESACRLLRGDASSLPPEQTYRCVKLGTTRAPLQVRIMKAGARTPTPEQNLQIHVRRDSFKQEEAFEQGITDAQGLFGTEQRKIVYDQVAFLSCLVNNAVRWQEPVPIYGDEPYDCFVKISDDPKVRLAFDQDFWEKRMYEADQRQSLLFAELSKADAEKRQATLEKAQKGLEDLDRDLEQFERKRKELLDQKMERTAGQSRLKYLYDKRDKLKTFIGTQEALIKEEKDPNRQKILQLAQQAQLFEGEREFGKALDQYKELNKLIKDAGLKDPKLDEYVKHIKKLEADWAIKNPDHEAARKFIYETWPALEGPDELKKGIPKAKDALDACRKAGDKLSPQKLAKVARDHNDKLKQKKAELNPDLNREDVKAAEAIEAVLDDLAKLLEQVNEVLKQDMPPAK